MKLILYLIVMFAVAVAVAAQSRQTNVVIDNTVYSVSTLCYGGKVCNSTVTSRPIATRDYKAERKAYAQQTEAICAGPREQYGKNLERFREPIDNDTARCVVDPKIKSWLIDQNYQKYLQGLPASTMHPRPLIS